MQKVKVTADKNGNIITISENPEYGYIRVEQNALEVNAKNFLRIAVRSALIKGKIEDLKTANFKANQELPGKIVIIESLDAFNPENPDKDLKIAGKSGIICTIDDQPIYRKSFYTANMDAEDHFIAHNNTIEIRQVQLAQKSLEQVTADDINL